MNTIGILATFAGISWAGALGIGATGAVALAFIGGYLMTTTYERGRIDKKRREEADSPA